MSSVRYLIRFDDICPGMNWSAWNCVESILKQHNIKPILAVVPDNYDPKLNIDSNDEFFWRRVRKWQSDGWFIGLHGYQHLYATNDPGLLKINSYSEFAGLSYELQKEKIIKAITIFTKHGVHPDGWVAPAHSFDETTIRVLLELEIDVISDGFYTRPVEYLGAKWVPQQIWKFRKMPFGLWTVCFHSNKFTLQDIENFRQNIELNKYLITSVDEILKNSQFKKRTLYDLAVSIIWLYALRLKKILKSVSNKKA